MRARFLHLSYGAVRVNTIGKLYVPGALLALVKSDVQLVLKNACAAVPFVEDYSRQAHTHRVSLSQLRTPHGERQQDRTVERCDVPVLVLLVHLRV